MKKDELIQHVKEIHRDLQTASGYSEVHANNDLVIYYNENWSDERSEELRKIKNEFFNLCLIFQSISSHSQQGHWKQVMTAACGWFLSTYDN